MSETWLGEKLVLVGKRRRYDVSGGPQTTLIYEGTHEDILGAESRLSGVNYDVDYSTGTPKAILTITNADYGDTNNGTNGSEITTTFELLNNSSQKSLLEHPKAIALGAAAIADIRTKLKASPIPSATEAGFTGDKKTIHDMLVLGQDAFLVSQWVFKLNQIITRKAQAYVTFSNLNRLYTTAQVIAETNPLSVFETALSEAYNSMYVGFYDSRVPAGHALRWLKSNFSLTNISSNRAAVSVEYWLEAWSTLVYDNSTVVV